MKRMTYSYELRMTSKNCMIRLMGGILLCLRREGWDPLTPVDIGRKMGKQTAICFKRRCENLNTSPSNILRITENPCLCIETFHDSYLLFHDVPSTVLIELVTTAHNHWKEGIEGVSMAMSSVICDYTPRNHAVLTKGPLDSQDKFVKLQGKPWTVDDDGLEDDIATENLELSIIACLAQEGYNLNMAINMNTFSRVFFFIKDEEYSNEVSQLNKATAGIGTKHSLCTYRPIMKRSRTSFFRSFNERESLNRRIKKSLKKKIGKESIKIKSKDKTAWYKQTSTDISTDVESDYEDDGEGEN